jgi:hypothetical protein
MNSVEIRIAVVLSFATGLGSDLPDYGFGEDS